MTRKRLIRIGIWILLGIVLRTVALDGNGLWMDEGYTAWTAHLSPEEHTAALQNDDAPPLYYAMQRVILPHLPPNEGSVRLLSAAAGIGSLVWLAVQPPVRSLIEAPVAFMALGTYGVYYGRQARSYAVLMLFGLILMTATSRVLEGRGRWLIVVALAEAAALWTHNVAANLVVGANLAWLLCGRRDPWRWIAAQVGAFLIWLPYLATLFRQQLEIHKELNEFIAHYWAKIPLALAPLFSLAGFTSGARLEPLPTTYRWFYDGPGSSILSIAALAAVLLLLLAAFKKGQRREALFATAFTLGPLVSLTIISALTAPSYTVARTDAIAYGGFVLWTALGLRGLPRPGRMAVIGIVLVSTVLATVYHFPVAGRERDNDRILGERVKNVARPGDWIVYVGAAQASIDYYLSNGRPGIPDSTYHKLLYPAIYRRNPASDHPISGDSLRAWEAEALRIRNRFEAEEGERKIFWIGPLSPGSSKEPTASDLLYPGSMLAYALNGLRPLDPIARLRADELTVDWLIFAVERDSLIPSVFVLPVEEAE